jgi:hypothetical protein
MKKIKFKMKKITRQQVRKEEKQKKLITEKN